MSKMIDDLTSAPAPRAPRIHDDQIVIKLPRAARALIKQVAEAQGISPSALVRLSIAEYFERRGYNRD